MPCFIIARDVLTPLRNLAYFLTNCSDVGPITIIDNGSSYPPLLDWYAQGRFKVLRQGNNGPYATWGPSTGISELTAPYLVTDFDLDLSLVPRDVLTILRDKVLGTPDIVKAGVSLDLGSLPDTPQARRAREWEGRHWIIEHSPGWYQAEIDTTFAVYRSQVGWGGYGPSLRAKPPYTARHVPWYLTGENLPEEWKYYVDHLEAQHSVWLGYLKGQS